MTLLGAVLPAGLVGVEAFGDEVDARGAPVSALRDAEADLVRGSSPGRTAEVRTTRHCARAALGLLGVAPAPVLRAPDGAPRWPAGVVGSMTHCAGYRAAVVAKADYVVAVGIDAEPDEPLPTLVEDAVVLDVERRGAAALRGQEPPPSIGMLLFSAKEATYKAWSASGGEVLRLERIQVSLADGTFVARVLGAGGRWAAGHGGGLAAVDDVPAAMIAA